MTFISPTNTITFDCSGNVLSNAIQLVDVDGTKSNKLLIGTQDGELLVYRLIRGQTDVQLWRRAHGLGFITAVTVGFLTTNTNEPRPVICVVNAEGALYLFLLRSNVQRSRVRSAGGAINTNARNDSKLQLHGTTLTSNEDDQQQIQPAFSQQLISNPKTILIQDYNEHDKHLVIGYNDRTIRVFIAMITEDYENRLYGRFGLKQVFHVADQISTLSSRRLSNKDYELIVAMSGGHVHRFNPNDENDGIIEIEAGGHIIGGWTEAIPIDKFCDEMAYAVAYRDHIDIFSTQINKKILTLPLKLTNGHLYGLRKGPPTKDNFDQLVTISSVDGDTFVVDRHLNSVRFRPPMMSNAYCSHSNDLLASNNSRDPIQAFTSGILGDNVYCFVYVLTHVNKIVVVHSIEISNPRAVNLITALTNSKLYDKLKNGRPLLEQLQDILHPQK